MTRATGATEETYVADLPPYPGSQSETGDDTGVGSARSSPASRPRWQSALGIVVVIVFLVLIVVLHLTGVLGPGLHG
jgi:hypothetical protein